MRYVLLICVCLSFAMGLVMIFNTTSADVLDRALDKNVHYAFLKQIMYAILGIALSASIWFVGYQNIMRLSFPLLVFFTFLLLLVFVPGIGRMANGAHRWIWIGGYTFQPSEFVKYLIPLFFIHQYLKTDDQGFTIRDFLKTMAIIAIPMILILVEPDNRSAGLIVLTLFVLFYLTRIKAKYWALPMAVIMIIGAAGAYHVPYVKERLKVYFNPELDLHGKGHQPHQAKIATGSGGLLGRGIGESVQKLTYLPEAQNDYIVAIFAEEFGFVGVAALISLYMVIAYIGFSIAHFAPDKGSAFIAAIFTFLLSIQAFVNFGVVSNLLPSTGLNLPFFSQGGSSLWVNMAAITVLMQISAMSKKEIRT
ncbi:MAG: cell division protein FtsW [Parachlamydiales bacterium]|nr:cell division protein FtsW [Parachlamydiales bacterium]